jgi:hypothetical protein
MKTLASVFAVTTLSVLATAASAWGWSDTEVRDGWGFGDDLGSDFSFGMNFSSRGSGRGRDYSDYRMRNGYGYYSYGDTAGIAPGPRQVAETKVR